MYKRFFAALTAFIILLCLSACGVSREVAGEDYILAAREAYTSLDSARVDVINDDTGISEQMFIFKYDETGMMTYSYLGQSAGTYIAQFNNGYEEFTEENGAVTYKTTTDPGFNAYSREIKYPYADEGLILFLKKAVSDEQSYIAQNDTAIEVCHVYDIEKLGDSKPDESIIGFTVKYFFDGEGNLLYFKEISRMALPEGGEKTYSYTIYITERNEVDSVPNLVKTPEDRPQGEPEDEPVQPPIIPPDGGGTLI